MKTFQIICLLCLSIFLSTNLGAQVTIGMNEAPLAGTLLQLKTIQVANDEVNATQGLLLPRVALDMAGSITSKGTVDKRFLLSLGLTSAAVVSGDALLHEGLTVYNISAPGTETDNDIFMDKKICPGVYTWTGTQWERSMPDYCL